MKKISMLLLKCLSGVLILLGMLLMFCIFITPEKDVHGYYVNFYDYWTDDDYFLYVIGEK